MKVSCTSCSAKYTIADEKVRGRKVKIRCKSCSSSITVDGTLLDDPTGGLMDSDDDDATRVMSSPPAFDLHSGAAASAAPVAAPTPSEEWSVNVSDSDQRTLDTAGIVAAWQAGELSAETYVWREGMADWQPVLDVPELARALQPVQSAAPAPTPPPAAAPLFTSPAPPAVRASVAPPRAAAARLSGGRGAGADLFGGGATAHEAPAGPAQAGSSAYDDKPTGARNESSVLFSLDALKATTSASLPAPSGRKGAPTPKGKSGGGFDDLMNLTAGPAPTINLNATPDFSQPPPPVVVAPAAPVPSVGGAPSTVETGAPASAGGKSKLVVAGAIAALLLIGGLAFALTSGKKGGEPEVAVATTTSEGASKPVTAEAAKDQPTEAPKAAEPKPTEDKPADDKPADDKPAADKPADDKPAADKPADDKPEPKVATAEPQRVPGPLPKPGEKKPEPSKKPEPTTPTPAPAPAGGAAFDRGAAAAALGAAAGAAQSCKKAGDPGGSGRATVTFAPSGRATSANISGAFGGTATGGCIAGIFRRARVPPFSGDSVTVGKSFTIN